MRPRRIVDEALQKLRRGDRATVTVTGIFHVRELRIDLLVVFGPEWHTPDPLSRRKSDLAQPFGQFVIVGEKPGVFGAERHQDRAGQSCEINHEFRVELFGHVPEHVGQH